MNFERMQKYIYAHSPSAVKDNSRFEHFYSEYISIISLIQSNSNEIPSFNHQHEEYEFIIPETPIPFLLYDDIVYFGEVGFIYPAYSGINHGSKYSMKNVAHTDIVIDKKYFESILDIKNIHLNEFKREIMLSEEIRAYLKAFKKEFKRDKECDKNKLEQIGRLLCIELAEACILFSDVTTRTEDVYRKGMYSTAEYILDNYNRDISIDEIALICGLSQSYFIRSFKKVFGCSPKQYILKIRISKAKIMLENTDKTITDICTLCGFNRINSFTSIFKKITGLTPTEYRKNIKAI